MLNHLKKFLKVDLRYKWLLINLVFGTFFMIAPYIYMVSPDQQVLTLKGMLCWFGLNQAFFGIGGFMEEERMDGTFTNLFLYPVQFRQYFIAKALQIGIESYLISLLQIFFFSLCNVHIPDLLHFIVILLINDIITANNSEIQKAWISQCTGSTNHWFFQWIFHRHQKISPNHSVCIICHSINIYDFSSKKQYIYYSPIVVTHSCHSFFCICNVWLCNHSK